MILYLKITGNFYYILVVEHRAHQLTFIVSLNLHSNPTREGDCDSHLKDDKTEAQKDEAICSADKASTWWDQDLIPGHLTLKPTAPIMCLPFISKIH